MCDPNRICYIMTIVSTKGQKVIKEILVTCPCSNNLQDLSQSTDKEQDGDLCVPSNLPQILIFFSIFYE